MDDTSFIIGLILGLVVGIPAGWFLAQVSGSLSLGGGLGGSVVLDRDTSGRVVAIHYVPHVAQLKSVTVKPEKESKEVS